MSRSNRPWPNTAALNRAGEAFVCTHCGRTVPGDAPGTSQRNHCPHCLRSRHVDVTVGDRRIMPRTAPFKPYSVTGVIVQNHVSLALKAAALTIFWLLNVVTS